MHARSISLLVIRSVISGLVLGLVISGAMVGGLVPMLPLDLATMGG